MSLPAPTFIIVDGPDGDTNVLVGNALFGALQVLDPSAHIMLEEDGWKVHVARTVAEQRSVIFITAGSVTPHG